MTKIKPIEFLVSVFLLTLLFIAFQNFSSKSAIRPLDQESTVCMDPNNNLDSNNAFLTKKNNCNATSDSSQSTKALPNRPTN